MIYVLDACALIALIKEEPGAGVVQNLIDQAIDGEITLCMNMVNLIEVHYGFYRDRGKEAAEVILDRIYKMPIHFQPVIDEKIFYEASRLKGTYTMSLADAIGLATAIDMKGVFVTADGGFLEPEAAEHAPVFWFRPPKQKD
ncbi:hypothetical protein FACS1894137_13670 [Spirochaetia bacterium]|nr:hypothetical protein FACS1894137_13670 [Spirochaetia bacterium]